MIYALPITVILLAALLGYRLGYLGLYWWVLAGIVAGAAGFAACIVIGRQYQGWDGIGYAIMAMLVITPGMGGLLLGTLMGWLRRRREARAVG